MCREKGKQISYVAVSLTALLALKSVSSGQSQGLPGKLPFSNRLSVAANPQPLLADYPEFIEPVREDTRLQSGPVVDDPTGDLEVRAWRFSYNARAIIETTNRLKAAHTAVIVVHPWGIDDGQGWFSPDPAGVAMFCTPDKNRLYHRHVREILNPFLKSLRPNVGLIAYSLPGKEDPIRKKLYRSIHSQPSASDRIEGKEELASALKKFPYKGGSIPVRLDLDSRKPVADYFQKFPGLDSGPKFNGDGFWSLPIPIVNEIEMASKDLVFYDAEGYEVLRSYLRGLGIRHVLLAGYCTDMCVASTTAGYKNVSADFNLFLVGDATLATFPATSTPRFATNAALCFASLNQFITQVSRIRAVEPAANAKQ